MTTPSKSKPMSKAFTTEKKFNTLKTFVREMSDFFQDDMSVKLYNHLLCKTTIKNRAPVKRHQGPNCVQQPRPFSEKDRVF